MRNWIAVILAGSVVLHGSQQDDKKRIADLEKQVKELEKTVQELKAALEKTKPTPVKNRIAELTWALKLYDLEEGAVPPSGNANMVMALFAGPKKRRYIEITKEDLSEKMELLDPWGHPFVFRNNQANYPKCIKDPTAHNKQTFDIYSFGPDGKDNQGGGDDVNNWE